MSKSKNDYFLGVFMAITTGALWSMLAIILKYSFRFASPATIAWSRFLIASSVLLLFFSIFKTKEIFNVFKIPKIIIIASLGLALNYFGYAKGLQMTSASNAQIFIQIGPLMLIFVSIFMLKEKISARQVIALVIALIGFTVFYYDQVHHKWESPEKYFIGNLWILLACPTWVIWALIQKKLSTKGHSAFLMNLVNFVVCTGLLLPFADFSELNNLNLNEALIMLALGLNTVLGYGAFTIALNKIPAYLVSIITACNPLLTLFILWLLEKLNIGWVSYEPLSTLGYIGAITVISGVVLSVKKA